MMTTNPNNSKEILLALLRAALAENCTPTLPPNIDWEAVRNLADSNYGNSAIGIIGNMVINHL